VILDPERPRRLLEEVLARREFGERGAAASDALARWLEGLSDALGHAPRWLEEALLVALVAGAALLLILAFGDRGGRARRARAGGAGTGTGDGAEPARAPARALLADGLAARAAGRWTEAVELLFRATVAGLVEHGLLLDDPARTNREHVRDLRARGDAARVLAGAVSPFERVRYGRRAATETEAERVATAAAALVPDLWRAAGGADGAIAGATREGAA
jgi:hypothetical protein